MARSTLRYVLPLAKLSLLAGLALSGCGGDASSTTGPMPITPGPATVAAAPVSSRPASAPAPTPAPRPPQVRVTVIAEGAVPGTDGLCALG